MSDFMAVVLGLGTTIFIFYIIIKSIIKKTNKGKKEIVQKEKSIKEKKVKVLKLKDIKHIEGISSLREEENVVLNVDDKEFTIISNIGNFNIALDRIVNAGILNKKEIEQKNKSVFGRALVGSVVGLGFLGALSGIGQKVKTKYNYFLVINYKDKNSDEIKSLVFGLGKYDSFGQLFLTQLTKRLNNEKVNVDL